MSLSEQCNPEIRPVENRRTEAPVNTEPEESKGEAVDFNEQARGISKTVRGKERREADGQGAEGWAWSGSSSVRVGHRLSPVVLRAS